MVVATCCQLVGNYEINKTGIISISTKSSTETTFEDPNLIIGPTIGTLSISAYAIDGDAPALHQGCASRISVNIPWLRKFDCDSDPATLHFIFQGQGNSSISGPADGVAELIKDAVNYKIVNASAGSGPTSIYEDATQYDGYGLKYYHGPWPFETSEESDVLIDTGIADFGPLPLSSFSYTAQPGQIPTANYEFLIALENNS